MSLKGYLSEFSLAEIFRLLDLGKKTGILCVENGDKQSQVFFREGKIFLVASGGKENLGNQLVKSGKLSRDQLDSAVAVQREDDWRKKLAEVLIEKKFVQPDALKSFMEERIQDTVFEIFTLNQGDFNFEMNGSLESQEEDIGLYLNVQTVIAETEQRLEEWESIKKDIPSFRAVLGMSASPIEKKEEIVLKSEEWQVLRFVDGRRSLEEIAESVGLSKFHTCKLLHNLYSAGLLDVLGEAGEEKEIQEVAEDEVDPKREELLMDGVKPLITEELETEEKEEKSEAELEEHTAKTSKEDIIEIIEEEKEKVEEEEDVVESKGEVEQEATGQGEEEKVLEIKDSRENSAEKLTEFARKMKKQQQEKLEEENPKNPDLGLGKNKDMDSVSYALKELSRLAHKQPEETPTTSSQKDLSKSSQNNENKGKGEETNQQQEKITSSPNVSKNLLSKITRGLKNLHQD